VTVKNVTVSLSCGKWFVSIQTEREVEQPIPNGGAVGIDMGVPASPPLATARSIAPLNSFKRHETALRKAQQAMSRKTKFSNNWKKAKARVQRIHSRIGNARRDYLHKCSTTISQNHAMVCIEDLQVRNMSKSAAGTTEQAGQERSGQVRPEQSHPRSRLVRVPSPTGLQAGVERRASHRRAGAEHQPDVSVLRPCVGGQPPDAGAVRSAWNAVSRKTPIWSARSMF
jgi:transposase